MNQNSVIKKHARNFNVRAVLFGARMGKDDVLIENKETQKPFDFAQGDRQTERSRSLL